jgi:hypothetical protein
MKKNQRKATLPSIARVPIVKKNRHDALAPLPPVLLLFPPPPPPVLLPSQLPPTSLLIPFPTLPLLPLPQLSRHGQPTEPRKRFWINCLEVPLSQWIQMTSSGSFGRTKYLNLIMIDSVKRQFGEERVLGRWRRARRKMRRHRSG